MDINTLVLLSQLKGQSLRAIRIGMGKALCVRRRWKMRKSELIYRIICMYVSGEASEALESNLEPVLQYSESGYRGGTVDQDKFLQLVQYQIHFNVLMEKIVSCSNVIEKCDLSVRSDWNDYRKQLWSRWHNGQALMNEQVKPDGGMWALFFSEFPGAGSKYEPITKDGDATTQRKYMTVGQLLALRSEMEDYLEAAINEIEINPYYITYDPKDIDDPEAQAAGSTLGMEGVPNEWKLVSNQRLKEEIDSEYKEKDKNDPDKDNTNEYAGELFRFGRWFNDRKDYFRIAEQIKKCTALAIDEKAVRKHLYPLKREYANRAGINPNGSAYYINKKMLNGMVGMTEEQYMKATHGQ